MQILPMRAAGDQSARHVGIDLAKKESEIVVLDENGKKIGARRVPTSVAVIEQLASELSPFDHVAFETTTNAFATARLLQKSGAKLVLSNPIATKLIYSSKVATDKIDARKLAELERVGYLPTVWLPDPDTEQLRHLMFDRQSLVDRRTELKNRIHGVLDRQLILIETSDPFSAKQRGVLRSKSVTSRLDAFDHYRIATMLDEIEWLDTRVDEVESIIASFICQREALLRYTDHLVSITGINLVVAAGMLAAIGDPSRFSSGAKLASYFGLVPSTFQSGDSNARHGRITKRGRAQARWLLIEAAEHLRKAPGPLKAFYARIARKRGHNVAVVAVARKLAELIWVLLTRDEDYIYAMPKRTNDKRTAIRKRARDAGLKVPKAGSAVVDGRSPLYGLELRGSQIKTEVARLAAQEAERLYENMIGSTPRTSTLTGFDPSRPRFPDYQRVLEIAAATINKDTLKKAKAAN